jgi:stage II sporulation protein D
MASHPLPLLFLRPRLWPTLGAFVLMLCGCVPPDTAPTSVAPQEQQVSTPDVAPAVAPTIRVLLIENQSSVLLTATQPPQLATDNPAGSRRLDVPPNAPARLALAGGSWSINDMAIGAGTLSITPASDASVSIDGRSYHGRYRLVPTTGSSFDVVNDVNVEDYLKSVLSSELPAKWLDETFKAQAVAARTYAIYCAKVGRPSDVRPWFDLFSDQRSQVYGGVAGETNRSRAAVDATAGMVVAAGPSGHERIIKAYFSSCCGGIGQSAADAFGDPPSTPLTEQACGALCSASPHYNWPPMSISKANLTRRLQAFGEQQNRAEKSLAAVNRVDVFSYNPLGRPVKFVITDIQGRRLLISGQDLRLAINAGAGPGKGLLSSYCQVINEGAFVRFVNGHGSGHGVGLCQWCAQRRAELGMRYDDIVLAAYPGAVVLRAY